MSYTDTILRILAEAGEQGLSIRKIAHHVYNEQNSLFSDVDYDEIHRDVRNYLMRQSRHVNPMVEHGEKWGVYRLNRQSPEWKRHVVSLQRNDAEGRD